MSFDDDLRARNVNLSDNEQNMSGSMVNPGAMSDILSYNTASQVRLKEIILPMLHSLLSSKESESKAGGLNILGSFCGLSYDFSGVKVHKQAAFF